MKMVRCLILSLVSAFLIHLPQVLAEEPALTRQAAEIPASGTPAISPAPAVTPSQSVSAPKKTPNRFERYYERVSEKFDDGAENFMLGWTEWISEPADYYQKKPGLLHRTGNTFIGLGRGVVIGTVDAVGGFGNAATAFLPQFQIPLPQGGVDLKRVTG